ncbi:MAG: porin [Pseudomonadota bacterium]
MPRLLISLLVVAGMALAAPAAMAGQADDLHREMDSLRQQMQAMQQGYEARLQQMQQKLEALEAKPAIAAPAAAPSRESLAKLASQGAAAPAPEGASAWSRAVQKLNPDLSVILDTFYYNNDTNEDSAHLLSGIKGFGDVHNHGDGGHSHEGAKKGFNLRHVELQFSAQVDPYFKGWATVAVDDDATELEEAVIQTTALPYGLKLQAGKFFSGLGRLNSQHSHEWDFVDQPLNYRLLLGDHNLLDKGVQASWLAPLPFHLLFGVEAFQGDNESSFQYLGEDLPEKDGPRLWVGWLKYAPNLGGRHGLQLGASLAYGVHQEAHDGDGDGVNDHFLDGHSTLYGLDAVYKYKGGGAHGQGDVVVQGEYLYRRKDLDLYRHDLLPELAGNDRRDEQDGFYLQGVYGFLPRWRAGLRWDQVGLINEGHSPTGAAYDYDASSRYSAMLDFSPTEFSRIRVQASRGNFALDDGDQDFWEFFVQLQVSLGTHGAHKF